MNPRDCCECLEALEMTFDNLMASSTEPDPTTPDPVAYLKAWIRWAKTRIQTNKSRGRPAEPLTPLKQAHPA